MSNILLDYNIDYSLSYEIDTIILNEKLIVPIKSQVLCIIIATGNEKQNIDELISIFKKPVKLMKVDEKYIQAELQYLSLKIILYKLANNALENIHKDNKNSYIINFVDELFYFCISKNVSDIHFEALDNSIVIRVRIDGELNQIFRFDIKLFSLVSSIIKYFGNLDISQKRMPLNGRFTREINKKKYDMRISTMPTVYGESIVLRILDNDNIQKDINLIGLDNHTLNIIKNSIQLTQGLILVTGPTGSGKTTTLYSMLSSLNSKNKKIITIEDPVEYKLDGIMQVNVNNAINLNYQSILKNILRQDPDILLIGEIRDTESLQIALQASLTGHLVIATLHTNNAIETITRLLDLQAEPYLVATTLKMILSQRLVRLLCEDCKVKDTVSNYFLHRGCKKCNYMGYKDRKIVSEILKIDETISNMIATKESILDITKYAKKKGFRRLKENADELVANKLTTLEEILSKV